MACILLWSSAVRVHDSQACVQCVCASSLEKLVRKQVHTCVCLLQVLVDGFLPSGDTLCWYRRRAWEQAYRCVCVLQLLALLFLFTGVLFADKGESGLRAGVMCECASTTYCGSCLQIYVLCWRRRIWSESRCTCACASITYCGSCLQIRPLLAKERLGGEQVCLRIVPNSNQVVLGKDRAFTFDFALSAKATQVSS